jgi:hypothetical protein
VDAAQLKGQVRGRVVYGTLVIAAGFTATGEREALGHRRRVRPGAEPGADDRSVRGSPASKWASPR